jgi:hypothetical protein
MNLDNLQRKLISAARATQTGDHVPFGFEKRIMARLAERAHFDVISAWSAALWRAAVGCVAVVVLSGALSLWNSYHDRNDFSKEFDTAVFASAGSVDETW